MRVRKVGINFSGLNSAMPQQFLDRIERYILHYKVGGYGMPESMAGSPGETYIRANLTNCPTYKIRRPLWDFAPSGI